MFCYLSVAIGTPLYFIVNENDKNECNAESLRVEKSDEWLFVVGTNGEYYEYTKMNDYSLYYIFGKTVFATLAEANEELKRQKGTAC